MDIEPIGFITSCYKEKFGIPRQPGLVPLAEARLRLTGVYNQQQMVAGLEVFSHVWLLFGFHATASHGWKATVRPPRLGGNKRVGVFASRSMYRPNGLGLSVCRLESVDIKSRYISLHLSGVDLLDTTPVFDIKPYLPYVDSITEAYGAYAAERPVELQTVIFSEQAEQQCLQVEKKTGRKVRLLIEQILQQDPRPAFHPGKQSYREYGMKLYEMNIRWCYLPVSEKASKNREVVKVLSLW